MSKSRIEQDIDLINDYRQWQSLNKGKGDTSAETFMVQRAQEEAFTKLEVIAEWFADNKDRLTSVQRNTLGELLE